MVLFKRINYIRKRPRSLALGVSSYEHQTLQCHIRSRIKHYAIGFNTLVCAKNTHKKNIINTKSLAP